MTKVTHKIPSQAASGSDTFSDALVGLQITNGSNQLTNANFDIDRVIPEKDSKDFRSDPFSDFLTLNEIKEEEIEISSSISTSIKKNNSINFKNSKNNGSLSVYGSLKERLGVTVTNIIKKFPAGVYVDSLTPVRSTDYSASNIIYDEITNITTFYCEYTLFYNPLDVAFIKPSSFVLPESLNDIRNFFSSYSKYVIDINNSVYDILYYEEPTDPYLLAKFKVKGNCFNYLTSFTEPFLIRPNNGYVEEFFNSLDDLESILLNRETKPKYTSTFTIMDDKNNPDIELATWPLSYDNWNISTVGYKYTEYLEKLTNIGENVDNYKSNLIVRFLTSPQLFEFDTEDKKMESILQIYGQNFDTIKKYIDNIKFMRNITYDGINNVPDSLLKKLSETLGLNSINLFNEISLADIMYDRNSSVYNGVSIGLNLIESENELYRRLLNNLIYFYKSKGTRKIIEFFLEFIGVPQPMIIVDEYVYKIEELLPMDLLENDINDVLSNNKINYIANISGLTDTSYNIITSGTSSNLYRHEYPVDEDTGLPRKYESSDGSIFFQSGAGWYKKTLDHRSSDVIDYKQSDLESKIKIIKTISKPYTYGEEYFDVFRKLPGLNYGYNLINEIDNKKIKNVSTNYESKKVLNRKNINIFLSPDNVINYDIYRKLLKNNFSTLNYIFELTGFKIKSENDDYIFYLPDDFNKNYNKLKKMSFDEFNIIVKNLFIHDSNIMKYDKSYVGLYYVLKIYLEEYSNPYTYSSLLDYINKISLSWTDIIEQFIPATTLWIGGNLLQNSMFERCKYQHKINRSLPFKNNNLIFYVDSTDLNSLLSDQTDIMHDISDNGGQISKNNAIYDYRNLAWNYSGETSFTGTTYSTGLTNNNVEFTSPSSRTFSFWFKPREYSSGHDIIFSISKSINGGHGEIVAKIDNQNRINIEVFGTKKYYDIVTEPSKSVDVNKWNLITIVLDQFVFAEITSYINSEIDSVIQVRSSLTNLRTDINLDAQDIGIGYSPYYSQSGNKNCNMYFNSLHIWNYNLTLEEIKEFFNNTKNKCNI